MDALRLSHEQLQQLASALNVTDADSTDAEKRCQARMAVARPAMIIPCGERADRRAYNVTLLNISETGVAIKDPPPLKCGDQFVLRLPPTESQPLSAILCAVVYSRRMADGSGVIGAQYLRPIAVVLPIGGADGATPEEREHLSRLEQRLMKVRTQGGPQQPKSDA